MAEQGPAPQTEEEGNAQPVKQEYVTWDMVWMWIYFMICGKEYTSEPHKHKY